MLVKETTKNGHKISSATSKESVKELIESININKLLKGFNFLPIEAYEEMPDDKFINVQPTIVDGTIKPFHLKLGGDHDLAGSEMLGLYFDYEYQNEIFECNAKCSLVQFKVLQKLAEKNTEFTIRVKATLGKPSESGTRPIYFTFKPTKESKKDMAEITAQVLAEQTV
jgi:hypothetical protein